MKSILLQQYGNGLCALFIDLGIGHIGVAKVPLYTMQQMIDSILEVSTRVCVYWLTHVDNFYTVQGDSITCDMDDWDDNLIEVKCKQ